MTVNAWLRWILLWLTATATADAHNPGLSSLRIEAHDNRAEITLQLTPPDLDADGRASPAELAHGKNLVQQFSSSWLRLTGVDGPMPVDAGEIVTDITGGNIVWRSQARGRLGDRWSLALPSLSQLGDGHREFVSVLIDGRIVKEGLLSRDEPMLRADALPASADKPAQANPSKFFDFVKLGMVHIVTGYDHLLYLAGLIIVCRSLRDFVPTITSFTVAHSLTLALATSGVVNLPSAIVEPLIAASIVFVGVENLRLRGQAPRRRWIVAFLFGLVHGFGFAGLLREIGIGSNGMLVPLLSFNLGVEIGQLAVVSIAILPLAWARRLPRFERVGLPALSSLVVSIGAYWFVERVWL